MNRMPSGSPDPEEVDRLCQAAAPAEPSEAEWARVLDRIERGLREPRVSVAPAARRGRWIVAVSFMISAAAAAAVFLVLMHTPPEQPTPIAPGLAVVPEAFPVTASEDVEIVSVDAADSGALVVGDLPLNKPIVLVEAGDFALRSVEANPDGEWVQMDGDAAPMVWAPLAVGGKD
jgi:hypothetical protein